MNTMPHAVYETNIANLTLIHRGKVRDMYDIDGEHILIVATDRLSAFDVILPTPVPGKGAVLKSVSDFWFEKTKGLVKNHSTNIDLRDVVDADTYEDIKDHAVIVKKMNNLPVEAIVRGYIIGSGWKDYQKTGAVCGIELPTGLKIAQILEQPIFTPSTKADVGDHDENISFARVVELLGTDMANEIKDISLKIYADAREYAKTKGIIIADTKFEFGTDKSGDLVLIDEVLTPDSSRFWNADSYAVGTSPASYDKQFVRDYLETLDWDKTAPGPEIPDKIIAKTVAKYQEAKTRITGEA